jgi:flagellar biosynthetic protein FliR
VSTPVLVVTLVQQVVVGAALGFCTHLLFAAVQAAGGLIDLFGGFSMAFAFDPFGYTGNAVFGRFYGILATAMLFATDAHQMVLAGFTRSYRALPASGVVSMAALDRLLTHGIGQMLLAALQIAGPLVAVLFLVDIALGLLSRVAPALNAFGLGFPAKILLTLAVAGMALYLIPAAVVTLTDQALDMVMAVLDAS